MQTMAARLPKLLPAGLRTSVACQPEDFTAAEGAAAAVLASAAAAAEARVSKPPQRSPAANAAVTAARAFDRNARGRAAATA